MSRWLHTLLCDKEEQIDNVLQRVKDQVVKDGHTAEDENMSEASDSATDSATDGATDSAIDGATDSASDSATDGATVGATVGVTSLMVPPS